MSDHSVPWNYVSQAARLKDHAMLLVAATRDSPDEDPARHQELADAIHAAGGNRVTKLVFDDDHPFSAHRLELAEALTRWLATDCAAGSKPR